MNAPVRSRQRPASGLFTVSETEASAIRAAFEAQGEYAAAIEVRRLLPAITSNHDARAHARIITGWRPVS